MYTSSNVWPPLELVDAATEAHTANVIKIIFVANNDNHSSY